MVIHILHVEAGLAFWVWFAEDGGAQQLAPGLGGLEQQVVVAYHGEEFSMEVQAVFAKHLFEGHFAGVCHLVGYVLHKVFVGCHYVKWLFLHLLLAKLIELLEAMSVDDFLQWPVVVASGVACVVEEHDFSILGRV